VAVAHVAARHADPAPAPAPGDAEVAPSGPPAGDEIAPRPGLKPEREPEVDAAPALTTGLNQGIVAERPGSAGPAQERPVQATPAPKTAAVPTIAATLPPVVLTHVDAAPISEVTAPAARVMPAPVHDQIVSAVVPLHGRGDGRHEVTLELRPEELGTIRVEVSVEHQTVHLTLHAAEPATSRLLSVALPELRSALADAGLTAGQVGVGPDGGGSAGARRPATDRDEAGRPTRGAGQPDDEPALVRTIRPAAAGRLDLFL
jgi:hypothetical protein